MDRKAAVEEISFRLTGGVLKLELDDASLNKVLDMAFREVQRYIDVSKFITLPYQPCIDLAGCGVTAVTSVYRTQGLNGKENLYSQGNAMVDPMYMAQWQMISGIGTRINITDYVYNYASWNTMMQIRNTLSTDLAFLYDKTQEKLYINVSNGTPEYITVEFVPEYKDVSELHSPYWEDIVMRLAVALAKVTVGRIRSRYIQTGALYSQDGERILEEGNAELEDLREKLYTNTQLAYPID